MHLLHKSVEIGNFFHGLAKVGVAVTLLGMAVLLYLDPGQPLKKKAQSAGQKRKGLGRGASGLRVLFGGFSAETCESRSSLN